MQPVPGLWRACVNAALGFLYPEVCQLCGKERATPDQGYVGESCRGGVEIIEPPFCSRCGHPVEGAITTAFICTNCRELDLHFSWARSAATAGGVLLEAIHRYKYNRQLWFEPFLAEVFASVAAAEIKEGRWDALVPVPLHPVKEREREFNQAERLARELTRVTGIPTDRRLLQRKVPTRTQTWLTRQERAENVRRAFALCRRAEVKDKRYLLIDDVFTTGATTSACAKVLLKGGAKEVAVWTLARGI